MAERCQLCSQSAARRSDFELFSDLTWQYEFEHFCVGHLAKLFRLIKTQRRNHFKRRRKYPISQYVCPHLNCVTEMELTEALGYLIKTIVKRHEKGLSANFCHGNILSNRKCTNWAVTLLQGRWVCERHEQQMLALKPGIKSLSRSKRRSLRRVIQICRKYGYSVQYIQNKQGNFDNRGDPAHKKKTRRERRAENRLLSGNQGN